MLRLIRGCAIAMVSLLTTIPAFANSAITFTFSTLNNGEQALSYFTGGYGGMGSGPGPNCLINFSPNAVVLGAAKGNLLSGNGTIVMNVHTEFANSIKLSYVTLAPEVVNVWSGYNGSGFLLATMTLMPNGSCGSLTRCSWRSTGEAFGGTAASVSFSGAGGEFGIGSIELGGRYAGTSGAMAAPEPSSIVLLPTGLAGLIWIYIRRRKLAPAALA